MNVPCRGGFETRPYIRPGRVFVGATHASPSDDRAHVTRGRGMPRPYEETGEGMANVGEGAVADLVIRGGTVVSPDASFAASVAIKDGKVLAVGAHEAMPSARETLDATGLHVLPGAIDVHVHFRDPGYPHKEDFESGTASAAFGGVTTVFDMPNTLPAVSSPEVLADKHRIAAAKAYVDYGLYAVLGEDSIAHVPALIDGGIIGFKLYMGNT